ncbi:MAG: adenosylcobinamide-GDP ribazoletransferase [Haloarculaceae archaeon]
MVLTALRGALGFLSRLPVDHDADAWTAFRSAPVAFVLAGYVLGLVIGAPVVLAALLGLPAPTLALVYLLAVYLVTGVNHADGVADLGDALAVHGDPPERRAVMKDTTVGVGALLALALVVAGLALGALSLSGPAPLAAAGLVIATEVGAKLGLAAVACLGTASHDGFGAEFTSRAGPAQLLGPAVLALPAALLTVPSPGGLLALVAGGVTAVVAVRLADARLDGVGGDVFGAVNEFGRVFALHAGVIGWLLL